MLNLKLLVHAILEDYALPWHGIHGVGHSARVLENGLRWRKPRVPRSKSPNVSPCSTIHSGSAKAVIMATAKGEPNSPPDSVATSSSFPTLTSTFSTLLVPTTRTG